MRTLTLTLRSDAYGDVCASITNMTTKSTEELSDFIEQFFDIASNKDRHGYRSNNNDAYRIAIYLKKKFRYSDDELNVTKPEVITRFY